MQVTVIGAGPAGLFFAALLKQRCITHEVTVYEQNPVNRTYGFGVGFSGAALKFLQNFDSTLYEAILALSVPMQSLSITHQSVSLPISGNHFYGIERLALLNLLKKKALDCGVNIVEGHRIENFEALEYDLLVGADGINSTVRNFFDEQFQPEVLRCHNKWIWYGSPQVTSGIELIFKQTEIGLFIGHTYRYKADRNTFVVECTPDTWTKAGLGHMSEQESLRFCENIFSFPLISNQSVWFTPKIVKSSRWFSGHITLIGDALKTMHPSIGSGTHVAMQDAIALADACHEHPENIGAALAQFEQIHRPIAEKIQQSALRSIDWYESLHTRLHLSPIAFAYDFMTRTGKISHERLRQMDPQFVAAYEKMSL